MKKIIIIIFLCIIGIVAYFTLSNKPKKEDFLYCFQGFSKDDYAGAKPFCEIACDANNDQGCANLGFIYLEGSGVLKGSGVNKDSIKAMDYIEKACKLNNESGCLTLGFIYEKGFGVNKNLSQAKVYYQKACQLDKKSIACNGYKILSRQGY